MTYFQKGIKYAAIAFAIFIVFVIITAILNFIGIFGIFFDFNDSLEDNMNYSKTFLNVKEIVIEIDTSNLKIKKGDSFKVEAFNVNKDFSCLQENRKLTVTDKDRFSFWDLFKPKITSSEIVINIPDGYILNSSEITQGVGELNIYEFRTDKLELELGVGDCYFNNLHSSEIKIEGGIGKIDIDNANIKNLDLESGIGKVEISGKVTGDSSITSGIGKIHLDLDGKWSNYNITKESGIGEIIINGYEEDSIDTNSENNLYIENGIGKITIDFK